jgi:hypothetical protein
MSDSSGHYAATGIIFPGCVVIAVIFDAVTVIKRIFYIQALPALVGLALLLVMWSVAIGQNSLSIIHDLPDCLFLFNWKRKFLGCDSNQLT